MQEKRIAFRNRISVCYMAAAVFMFLIVILLYVQRRGNLVDNGLEGYEQFDSGWTDEDGNPVAMDDLSEQGEAVLCRLVPEMEQDTTLVFRSQNVYVRMELEGELLYETDKLGEKFYEHSSGSRWNLIKFSPDQAGAKLVMRIAESYPGEGIMLDHFYWGDRAAVVLGVVRNKLVSLLISLTICLGGFFMMLLDVTLNYRKKRKDHSLRCLGFFSVCIGAWCLIETNVLQFLSWDPLVLQAADNMFLILSLFPILLYAEWTYGVLRYPVVRAVCVMQLIFLFCCVVFPLAGLMDWHSMLPVARVFMGICALAFMVWTAQRNVKILLARKRRRGAGIWAASAQLLGIMVLSLTAILELVRFNAVDVMDRAALLRFGLLVFIVCFAVGSQFSAYQRIVQGLQYDSVHKLAYSDILTSLGNRAAYLERLEHCVTSQVKELGIVFFDVNHLKRTNDTYGHDVGDMMIQMSARIIAETFGVYGMVFRIGGDEFCALLEEGAQEKYDLAADEFAKALREANQNMQYDFVLQIAQGFAVCQPDSMETVEQTVRDADARMYRHKAFLKKDDPPAAG